MSDSNKQAYLYILNALNFSYLNGNTTKIDAIQNQEWLSLTFNQPFWVITRVTGCPLYIETDDARYSVEPGQALIIPAHTRYRIKPLGREYVTHWLNMNLILFDHLDLLHTIKTPYVTTVSAGNKIGRLHGEITALMNREHTGGRASLIAMLQLKRRIYSLLELIMSFPDVNFATVEEIGKFERFRPVLTHIERHLAGDIKVSRLAELMYLSNSHFYKEFQEAFGLPPMQFISQQRLKKAQYLLATTDLTIKEIGNRVGYGNPYSFNRFFKAMHGSTPGQYKKTAANSMHSIPY